MCKYHGDHRKNPVVETRKIMIKELEHTATESYQCTKEDSKRGSKEQRIYKSQKTVNEMAIVLSPYLSII